MQSYYSTPQIDITHLNWENSTKTFSQEASTLRLDCTTEKLMVNNHKNKTCREFVLVKRHYTQDEDHELTHVEYSISPSDLKNYPNMAGIKLLIWND